MADVSPGGPPDRGAPPPSSEAPTSAFPGSAAPPPAPVSPAWSAADPAAPYLAGSAAGPSVVPAALAAEPVVPPIFPSGTAVSAAGDLTMPSEAVAQPPADPFGQGKTGWRRWLPMALVIAFLAAGAIGMLIVLGSDMGPAALAVGLAAAVVPVPLLAASFLWLDRYEPEPVRYLAFAFAWGAAIATLVAIGVNQGMAWVFDKIGLPDALVAVLVAPFIEESMKALGPILLFWRRRHEWSGITDGIVYCGLSALGFAMVENVLYLGKYGYASGVEQYGPATGLRNLFLIFIVRILFTGFAHPLFTSMTGIGLGIASRTGNRLVRVLAPIAGLLLAMMLHGTFNLLPTLSAEFSQPFIMLYGYLGFMVPLFFAVVGFAIALRSWEGRLTERILPSYVRSGWFSPPEVAALGSLGRRHSARQWAKRVAGASGQRAMKSFQFAATQLALLRDGLQRGIDHRPAALLRAEAEEKRLLDAIVEYRSVFAGRDPQTPQAFWDGQSYQIAFPDGVVRTVTPPAEPVVPVPVRYAPAYYPGYPSQYGPPGYPASPYGAGPYGAPGSPYGASPYGAPGSSHGAPPYGTASSPYGTPGYAPGAYGTPAQPEQPTYGGQPGYPGRPSYPGQQQGYPAQPSSPYYGAPAYQPVRHQPPVHPYGYPDPTAATGPVPTTPGDTAPPVPNREQQPAADPEPPLHPGGQR